MSWRTLVVLIFIVGFVLPAAAETGCGHLKFGSKDWWYCISKGGPD